MSDLCEHPFCTRLIIRKCSNHCQLDLCEEHLTEHKNLFLAQYEKSFNNLKKTLQGLFDLYEELKKTIDTNYQKKISLLNENSNNPSNEFEEKSLLISSTENLIKKKLQLLNDVKNDQALLYQYDIEQIKLYRSVIDNCQPMEIETYPSTTSISSLPSSPHSNFVPDEDEEEEEDEEDDDDTTDQSYCHRSGTDTKRGMIMNYYGQCPLTRFGIYGLQEKHNLTLCTLETSKSEYHLLTHLYNYHHIKWSLAYELIGAIIDKSNPNQTCIFKPNIDVIDKRFYVRYCPLKEMKLSNCRKKFFKDSLEQHLANVHHLSVETRKKIVETVENNGSLIDLDLDKSEFK